MATAAPHVKLLRQLASAKDDYLSGAFDISWDGAKATLYLVFGRPSHAVFETDQAQIEGEAAIDALLAALPRVFVVSDWRRAMSPHETLSITIDELAAPFVRLAGSYADDPVAEEAPEWWSAVDDSPDLPFGLADFPLLPGGRPLWLEASPDEVRLADRLADLPPSILILTGAKLRAAAVVSGGDLIDAVWIDSDDHARGETAGMAILGATKGSLAGYALDDPRVAEALTMLWRLPLAVSGVELSWLDPASMLAAFRGDGLDRVLVIDAPVRGIALFSRGGLVAVYSETQRSAVASPERLRSLLSQARGRLTVMERKPRPVAMDATPAPVSAHEFFGVAPDVAPEPDGATVQDAALEPAVAETTAGDGEPPAVEAQAATHEADPEDITAGEASDGAAPEAAVAENADDDLTASAAAGDHEAGAAPTAEAPEDAFAPPPPPPPADEAASDESPPPPPPAPEAAEPTHKSKRSRWGFGRSRKSRADKHAVDEALAGVSDLSADGTAAETASFEGWSVRQPNANAQPVWLRSHTASDPPPAPADASPEAEAATDAESAPTWSVAHREGEAPAAEEPATTTDAAPTWSVASPEADAPAAEVSSETTDAPPTWSVAHREDEPATTPVSDPAADATPAWLVAHPDDATVPDRPSDAAETEEAGADPDVAAEPAAFVHWLDAAVTGATHDGAAIVDRDAEQSPDGDGHGFAFVSLDEPASAPEPQAETDAAAAPETPAVPETWAPASWLDDVVHGPDPEAGGADGSAPAAEAAPEDEAAAVDEDANHVTDAPRSTPALRTPGPWSWPLAEPDEDTRPAAATAATSAHAWDEPAESEPAASDLEPAAVGAEDHEDTAASLEDGAEPGFFRRDEPVGSQYVDFDEVRHELVQIGIVWLGETNAVQVTALLSSTRSTIDDFVATIDTIRGLHVDGQDPASIQAMAREMHQQAAERLCGA
jgi:hypothetical protein